MNCTADMVYVEPEEVLKATRVRAGELPSRMRAVACTVPRTGLPCTYDDFREFGGTLALQAAAAHDTVIMRQVPPVRTGSSKSCSSRRGSRRCWSSCWSRAVVAMLASRRSAPTSASHEALDRWTRSSERSRQGPRRRVA